MIGLDPVTDDPALLRRAYGCFPSGVTAICSVVDGIPVGMAASAFTCVSMTPPLVSVCIQESSTTWPRLRTAARLGISVLAAHHDAACLTLSRKVGNRFEDVQWEATAAGAVLLDEAVLWLDCVVHDEVPAGDHRIVLLRIEALRAVPEAIPLVFHASGFRRLAAVAG